MKKTRRWSAVLILALALSMLTGCSKKELPDNAHDVLSITYRNMKDPDCFSMRSNLKMDMEFSGNEKNVEVMTNVYKRNDPYEIILSNDLTVTDSDPVQSYLYCSEVDGEKQWRKYKDGNWKEIEQTEKDGQYDGPISFDLYLIDTESFEIVSKGEEETVLEGNVSKDNIASVLEQTGVLQQLALTSYPNEKLKDLAGIKVRVFVSNESQTITKLEVDMKDTFQALTTLLFGEDSIVNPKINECMITIDQIVLNEELAVEVPAKVKESLDTIRVTD